MHPIAVSLLALGGLVLTSCTAPRPQPALPERETLFEGLEIAGKVILAVPDETVEIRTMPPAAPQWRKHSRPSRGQALPPTQRPPEPDPLLHLVGGRAFWPVPPVEGEEPGAPQRRKPVKPESVERVLRAAASESLVRPTRDAHFGGSAITRYAYSIGKVYELVCSVQSQCLIMLPPGERLASTPVIDKEEWDVQFVKGGEGPQRQETVIVWPTKPGLTTRMPLMTQAGRAYFVALRSTATLSQAAITWELPELLSQESSEPVATPAGHRLTAPPDQPMSASAPMPHVAVNRIHTAWQIDPGKNKPAWIPLSVWDDGTKIIIQFSSSLGYTIAPGVYALNHQNKAVLVESTPWEDGDPRNPSYYVVSGLYPILILKDGQGHEVRLTRLTGRAEPYREVTHANAPLH